MGSSPPFRPDIHTVIVTVDADPAQMTELLQHARTGLSAFIEYLHGGRVGPELLA